jgi:hypoxanthine phosphoribosyltransferase
VKRIKIHDRSFRLFIQNKKIRTVVEQMAKSMNHDLAGKKPLFVCILNGSFIFASELFRRIEQIGPEITFVRLASYSGEKTGGTVRPLLGLHENIEGRTVVILEDIIDTGLTINHIYEQLKEMNPRQIIIATLLLKPDALREEVQIDYVGLRIPNDFIVGYGLDYEGYGRNLNDIYSIINE